MLINVARHNVAAHAAWFDGEALAGWYHAPLRCLDHFWGLHFTVTNLQNHAKSSFTVSRAMKSAVSPWFLKPSWKLLFVFNHPTDTKGPIVGMHARHIQARQTVRRVTTSLLYLFVYLFVCLFVYLFIYLFLWHFFWQKTVKLHALQRSTLHKQTDFLQSCN